MSLWRNYQKGIFVIFVSCGIISILKNMLGGVLGRSHMGRGSRIAQVSNNATRHSYQTALVLLSLLFPGMKHQPSSFTFHELCNHKLFASQVCHLTTGTNSVKIATIASLLLCKFCSRLFFICRPIALFSLSCMNHSYAISSKQRCDLFPFFQDIMSVRMGIA